MKSRAANQEYIGRSDILSTLAAAKISHFSSFKKSGGGGPTNLSYGILILNYGRR